MKKETIVAIILGVVFGVFFSLLIINLTKKKSELNKDEILTQAKPTLVVSPIKNQSLEISTPKQEEIVTKDVIALKGKGEKNSLLIIQSPQEEKILKLENEDFSTEIKLILGENIIKITNYQQNNIDKKTVKVYYLKE